MRREDDRNYRTIIRCTFLIVVAVSVVSGALAIAQRTHGLC